MMYEVNYNSRNVMTASISAVEFNCKDCCMIPSAILAIAKFLVLYKKLTFLLFWEFVDFQFNLCGRLSSLTPSLVHSRLKTYLFHKSFQPDFWWLTPWLPTRTLTAFRTYYAHLFVLFSYHYFFLFSDLVW